MFDFDEYLLILAQNIRPVGDRLEMDSLTQKKLSFEGEHLPALKWLLRNGHLRKIRFILEQIYSQFKIHPNHTKTILSSLLDLNIITTNRYIVLSAESIMRNPSDLPTAPRTGEDLRALVISALPRFSSKKRKAKNEFEDLLLRRSSGREYSSKLIDRRVAKRMLWLGYGGGQRRTVPSAGALYPCGLYMLHRGKDAYRIILGDGATKTSKQEVSFPEFKQLFLDHTFCTEAPLLAIITADYGRSTQKYGARGWRYAILEAGHIGQNLCLGAKRLYLQSCEIGAFLDVSCQQALGIPDTEIPILAISFGYPARKVVKAKSEAQKLLDAYVGSAGVIASIKTQERSESLFPERFFAQAQVALPKRLRGRGSEVSIVGGESDTAEGAVIKAIAEGVERFCAGWRFKPPWGAAFGCWSDSVVIDRHLLQKFASGQKKPAHVRDAENQHVFIKHWVHSWPKGEKKLIPGDFLFYPYQPWVDPFPGGPIAHTTSSGMAAHWSTRKALWNGVKELLERENFLAWWYSGAQPPTLDSQYCVHLEPCVSAWQKKGIEIRFLDISINLPTVCAVAFKPGARFSVFATAADANPTIASQHAFSELVRGVDWVLNSESRNIQARNVSDVEDHLRCYASGYGHRYARWWSSSQVRSTQTPNLTALSDRQKLLRIIDAVGPLWYYHYKLPIRTFPNQPLKVIRAIIPGVTHIKFGYGEQDLGLPRIRKLIKQCQKQMSGKLRRPPLLHPLA